MYYLWKKTKTKSFLFFFFYFYLIDLAVPTNEVSLGIDSEGTCDEDDEEKGREKKLPLEGNSFALKFQQYKALQIKRFHRTKRNPKAIICEVKYCLFFN